MADRISLGVDVKGTSEARVQVVVCSEEQFAARDAQPLALLQPEERATVQRMAPLVRFRAEMGQHLSVPQGDGMLLLVGLGKGNSARSFRRAAATAIGLVPDGEPFALRLPGQQAGTGAREVVRAVIEGLLLGGYQFTGKSEPTRHRPGPVTLVTGALAPAQVAGELARARGVCEGIYLARDLVNQPASDLGPGELADAALELARRHGLKATCFRGDELLEQGFRLVHAVGRASAREPTFTVVETTAAGSPLPRLGLVGKGVVFDSGGLNLKSGNSMLLMRKDMGGAGTALGILDSVCRLGLDVPLTVVIPAAENSVGPDSYRPGDVLRSYSGRTVEIGNTDAEGRLLLADGLAYAADQGCQRLLDLATLTGAARVALGPEVPALFGTDEELVRLLLEESSQADEAFWRMPLVEDYERWLDTPFADLNHIGSDNRAGAITAALFLRRFVGGVPWAHVDVYAWEDQGKPETPKGANGMGVRAVVGALERLKLGAAG